MAYSARKTGANFCDVQSDMLDRSTSDGMAELAVFYASATTARVAKGLARIHLHGAAPMGLPVQVQGKPARFRERPDLTAPATPSSMVTGMSTR